MKKVRVCIVGTNIVSDNMVEESKTDSRFDPVAVCSRHHDTGLTFVRRHDIPAVIFNDIDQVAASQCIDAVYIASPNYAHASQAIACMNAGKHVLCEKPLASNSHEVSLMIEAAQRNNVTLMEAMIPSLSPALQAVVHNLHRVGTIRRYFSSFCQYSSRYDAFKQGNIANAFKLELSNGAAMDIGVYCIYPMVALFGTPAGISSTTIKLSTGVDGQGTIIAHYGSFDGVIMYSKISDSLLPTEIQGEEGTITIDRINNPRHVTFKPRGKDSLTEVLYTTAHNQPYYTEMHTFIDCILNDGAQPPALNSLNTSLATIKILDEIRRHNGITYPADDPIPQ